MEARGETKATVAVCRPLPCPLGITRLADPAQKPAQKKEPARARALSPKSWSTRRNDFEPIGRAPVIGNQFTTTSHAQSLGLVGKRSRVGPPVASTTIYNTSPIPSALLTQEQEFQN